MQTIEPCDDNKAPLADTVHREICCPDDSGQSTAVDYKRYIIFPIRHDKLWSLYKQALASFWTVDEVDLTNDIRHWDERLTAGEKALLSTVLAFFASSDAIVNDNLVTRFYTDVPIPEARFFYSFQAMIENIHSEMYSLLIDTYIRDQDEKIRLFWAVEHVPCVERKARWALQWTSASAPFPVRLIAFAVVEGIFFSGSFAVIFWFKSRGLMPGLAFSNELISRDEGLHTTFACALYKELGERVHSSTVYSLIQEAVDVEHQFWDSAFDGSLLGMGPTVMKQYVEFVADHLLDALGYDKLFKRVNPFNFMELISLEGKTNFFERRVGEYSKAFVGHPMESKSFNTDVDF